MCGHAISIHLETKKPISLQEAKKLLASTDGVIFMDDVCPTPVSQAAGNDAVYVGRVHKDISHDNGLNLWVVADNLRKGAALNALQIADCIMQGGYFK